MELRNNILRKLKRMEKVFPEINFTYKVNFNLTSNLTMGQYSMSKDIIYFNMDIAKKSKDVYDKVIVHEFAHMIATKLYGKNIQEHGKEWKSIMKKLNAKDLSSTIDFGEFIDNRIKVSCNCSDIYITKNRLTRLRNGREYKCKKCSGKIKEVV